VAERVEVAVSPPYPVVLGELPKLAATLSETLDRDGAAGVLITDSNVGPHHAAPVREALSSAGFEVRAEIEVPAGEASKRLAVYADALREMARSGVGRDGTLFALGGGVVGDLGGFLAATYMRGIRLVQLPTSLLAMVDSSVGGKVGVDLPEGKNLVGSFYRPGLVFADLSWLETLPSRELSCGLAEVVKMGLLAGGSFFEGLPALLEGARAGDPDALRALILFSVRFKAGVVAEDEAEGGRRAILNYGHTVGHGLEAAAGYALPHGEAVSAGMCAEARLARERFGVDLLETHESLLAAAGLPLRAPSLDAGAVLGAMARDKKRRAGDRGFRFVLLEGVGSPVWGVPVGEEEVLRAIGAVVGR
jgi:3-dehydroquinate synthase